MEIKKHIRRKKVGVWMLIGGVLLSCSGKQEAIIAEHTVDDAPLQEVTLRLGPSEKVDSAQVFFFRASGRTDTLVWHEVIHDIEYMTPHVFRFNLPAGKYNMWIFGNVPTDRMVAHSPYTPQDFYFDYGDGHEPGAVFYGRNVINIGVDTVNIAGMMLLSSFVQLTIPKVPLQVRQIRVELTNTASGLNLAGGYLQEPMDPPLSHTLDHIQGDSTYVTAFYCFPGIGKEDESTLVVNCFDEAGQMIYSGTSQPFEARPGYSLTIACAFANRSVKQTRTRDIPGKVDFILEKQ